MYLCNKKSTKQIEEDKINKEALGVMAGFALDIAKMVFAGVILVGIVDMSLDKSLLFTIGLLTIIVFVAIWYVLFKRSKRKD